jgi:hypothetical protein
MALHRLTPRHLRRGVRRPSSDEKHDGEVKDWAYFANEYFKKGQSRVWFVQAFGRTMQAAARMGFRGDIKTSAM